MADKAQQQRVRATAQARVAVNKVIANAASFIRSVEETEYLASMPMDQMLEQAIRQLGEPTPDGSLPINLGVDAPSNPPTGRRPRRTRILAIQEAFNSQLEQIKNLPDLSDPDFEEDLLASFGDRPVKPDSEKAGG